MKSVWSYQPDMPSFRDPDGLVWHWDAQSKTYIKSPNTDFDHDRSHGFGGDANLFDPAQGQDGSQDGNLFQPKNPLMEGYMANSWAGPGEVKCPNCQETTQDHICPTCEKDLTPEWNQMGDESIKFDAPPQIHHLDGMPERVPRPNHDHWDNSFPSMITHFHYAFDEAMLDMLTSGPAKSEIGKWLLDRQGHLHYEHGMHSDHTRLAARDGLNWPGDIGVTGSVYNDGTADVLRVYSNFPFNQQQVEPQLAQAFGEGVQLNGPVSGEPAMDKGQMFQPMVIQGGQWLIAPQSAPSGAITGIAWVRERANGAQYQPHMIFVCEHMMPEDVAGTRPSAIITAVGGASSHAAYLASTEGIPCVVGVGAEYNKIETGNYLKIDPTSKTITVIPAATGQSSPQEKHDLWNSILQHQHGVENNMTPKPEYFSHVDEELAWKAAHALTLVDCPECFAPMMRKNAATFCPDCGHIQRTAGPELLALPLIEEGLGGMAGGGAAAGGLGGMGSLMNKALQGAAWQGGKQMMPGGGAPTGTQDSMPQGPPQDDSQTQGVIASSDEDDESVGTATKNDGQNSDPDQQSSSGDSPKEHGDAPEQLKDVDGIGGPKDSAPMAMHDPALQDKAMKAYHMNLPLVIEFANSDEAGFDNPILKALDELLEQAFPGYKDATDPSGGTPMEEHPDAPSAETEESDDDDSDEPKGEPKKESNFSLWHVGHEVDAAAWGDPAPTMGMPQPGMPVLPGDTGMGVAQPCPKCGYAHAPGAPCQNAMQPGDPNGQQPTMPGSAVAQKVITREEKIAKWSVEAWGNPGDGYNDALEHPENMPGGPSFGEEDAMPNPECPACGGPGVPLGTLGQRQHFRCRNCGMDFSNEGQQGDPSGDMHEPYPQDRPEEPGFDMPSYSASVTAAEFMYAADEHTEHHHHNDQSHGSPTHDSAPPSGEQDNQWMDEAGMPLAEGTDYELKSPNYAIPDRITVTKVLPEKLVFTIHSGDVDYQDEIHKQDIANEGYTFGPVVGGEMNDSEDGFPSEEAPVRPGQDATPQVDDLSAPATVVSSLEDYTGSFSGDNPDARSHVLGGGPSSSIDIDPTIFANVMGVEMQQATGVRAAEPRYAGRDYSPREQREFIDESATARNLELLNLAGTHYVEEPELDIAFNW